MCVLKEFCCGCTLRSAAITAAVLNAIGAIGMIASGAQNLGAQDALLPYSKDKEAYEKALKIVKIFGGFYLALGLLSLVIFICLVIGIVKNKAGFVMPWLIGCMIYIVFVCIFILVLLSYGFYAALVGLLGIAFYIYLWIAVLNYYRELRDGPPSYSPENKG